MVVLKRKLSQNLRVSYYKDIRPCTLKKDLGMQKLSFDQEFLSSHLGLHKNSSGEKTNFSSANGSKRQVMNFLLLFVKIEFEMQTVVTSLLLFAHSGL